MATTEPKTWDEAVKQAGSEAKAAIAWPSLDPRYQADIKKYGRGKGTEEYSHDVIDPATGVDQRGEIQQIAGDLPGSTTYENELQQMKQGGGLGSAIADVGSGLLDAASRFGGVTTGQTLPADAGGPGPTSPAAAKPKTTTTPTATTPAPPSAAEALMNSLVSQYQGAMATVNPYIGGSNAPGFAAQAQALGEGIAGGGVQAPNATGTAVLNKDAQAVEAANNAGVAGITGALKDTGQADQELLQVSPYMGILNALTSEAQYKTENGTPPTSITGAHQPAWLQQAYQATIGASAPGTSTVGSAATVNPNTSATSPSTDTTNVAGGGNA